LPFGKYRHKSVLFTDKFLIYRLNIVPIVLPPLRERRPDIALLTHYFAGRINDSYGMLKEFSPQAVETLERHTWPGNVRELENLVKVFDIVIALR